MMHGIGHKGLGTRIALLIKKTGIKKDSCSSCQQRELKINNWEERIISWVKKLFRRKPSKAKARKKLALSPPQEKDRTAAKEAYRAYLLAQQKG